MKLTLGLSPCPNDTFIFEALINHKINTAPFEFDVVLEDVQTLNAYAKAGHLHVTKISYGALPLLLNHYKVLNSGGALGKGVGPLLIGLPQTVHKLQKPEEIKSFIQQASVAIPGENTTAHLLFSLAFQQVKQKQFIVFNEIENSILTGNADAGVIIHESRFTYRQKGLELLMDLGAFWEQTTGAPIPLGGIVIKRSLDNSIAQQIDVLIQQSVEYAFQHYYKNTLPEFITKNAQEMSEEVMKQHIQLYVNNYSVQLGDEGKKAVLTLLNIYEQLHPEINFNRHSIFNEA
jgi:1,4-dihydroxy-6-naphthoate synthase